MIKGNTLKQRVFLAATVQKPRREVTLFEEVAWNLATNFSASNGQHVISHDLRRHWAVVV
jgi:hypothetical protein